MSKDEFIRLRHVIEGFSQTKALTEFMLSDEYDGPAFPAIIRASAEGGLEEAKRILENAWSQLEALCK